MCSSRQDRRYRSSLTRTSEALSFEDGVRPFSRGIFPVRSLINTLLTCLILACPFLCGADEVGHSVQHGHASGKTGNDNAPAHCPESSDNCVCRGAVQASDVRAIAPDFDTPAPLFLFAPPIHLAHPLHHLTWEGSPTGLASWGDSLTIRALLQNFRC